MSFLNKRAFAKLVADFAHALQPGEVPVAACQALANDCRWKILVTNRCILVGTNNGSTLDCARLDWTMIATISHDGNQFSVKMLDGFIYRFFTDRALDVKVGPAAAEQFKYWDRSHVR